PKATAVASPIPVPVPVITATAMMNPPFLLVCSPGKLRLPRADGSSSNLAEAPNRLKLKLNRLDNGCGEGFIRRVRIVICRFEKFLRLWIRSSLVESGPVRPNLDDEDISGVRAGSHAADEIVTAKSLDHFLERSRGLEKIGIAARLYAKIHHQTYCCHCYIPSAFPPLEIINSYPFTFNEQIVHRTGHSKNLGPLKLYFHQPRSLNYLSTKLVIV